MNMYYQKSSNTAILIFQEKQKNFQTADFGRESSIGRAVMWSLCPVVSIPEGSLKHSLDWFLAWITLTTHQKDCTNL